MSLLCCGVYVLDTLIHKTVNGVATANHMQFTLKTMVPYLRASTCVYVHYTILNDLIQKLFKGSHFFYHSVK